MKPIVPVRWLGRVASIASRPLHVIASLKLAVALLVLLAAVLAWATILEATRGREMAQWYVYTSPWFIGLLGLLGGNILAATLIRWPWRTRQVGFAVTHAGLLVLLAGAVQTFQYGIEGQVTLREGDRTDKVLVRDRSLITVEHPSGAGRLSSQFAFHPGAVDWREGKTLEFGESQSLALEVLKFYRYARPHIDWVADAQDDQGPALRLALSDGTGQTIAEDWLTASTYGGEVLVGPTRYALLPIPVESMLQDFLQPPTDDLGTAGVLSMHFDGKMYRARIDDQKGKTVPLGDSGVSVEIVDYYADAKPTPNGRQFVARSDKPRNPILELRVHLPGAAEPIRQLAFAKVPLLNLDGVSGHVCPVKFWYHHANIPQTPGAIFLQTPAGKLYCRRVVDGSLAEPAEVALNQQIPVGAQFHISVVKHLPQARREITFTPLEPGMQPASTDEAAVLVDLTVDGKHRQLWLSRGDGEFGLQTVFTPQGLVAVTFRYQQLPLGVTIELEKFQRSVNPGRAGDAAFASTVKLLDPALGTELSGAISMNEPLTHGKFTFYQSSFQALRGNSQVSVLTAAYDPGRLCKYWGSVMICGGIFLRFAMGIFSRHQHTSVVIAVLLLGATPGSARAAADATFDWQPWQSLATQDGGRVKPLDSLAWETLRLVANRGSLTDPDTGQKLDAVQAYLVLLFDWQGGDLPQSAGGATERYGTTGGQGVNNYFGPHQSDKWDCLPLIRVDGLELRAALGIKKGEKSISPFDLNQAKVEVPGTHEERPFVLWAEGLRRREKMELTAYEKTALELADRYGSYQSHRMGERLFVLPIKNSEHQQWMSVAELASAKFDEQSDRTGQLREAQKLFMRVRAAYVNGSSDEFSQASAAWLQKMSELGPQVGDYASPTKIRLEVLYNHWVPFRCAWVCLLLACVCLLLNMGSGWKTFLVGGWSLFLCGSTAVTVGLVMRVLISGRAPVTNMYESVVYVGLGVALLGMLIEAIYRQRTILTAASAVATVALILADNCPAVLDPSLRPLQPVLRNNFWLVTHVMTITLSYAAFALALGISNITLGYYAVGAGRHAVVDSLTSFTYRAMQIGVWLLAAGTLLGGVWADYSWGRFWGWDPKEVWALIALLGYLAVLHAKHGGWVRQFGLAALCAFCFSLVVMAWYGVNFVLRAGLHSYGFGGGGTPFVVLAVCLQAVWVAAAGVRYAWQRREEREVERLRYNPTTSRLVSSQPGVSLPTVG